jgi:hypothetical protein
MIPLAVPPTGLEPAASRVGAGPSSFEVRRRAVDGIRTRMSVARPILSRMRIPIPATTALLSATAYSQCGSESTYGVESQAEDQPWTGSYSAELVLRGPPRIRTETVRVLNPSPLPVGIVGRVLG